MKPIIWEKLSRYQQQALLAARGHGQKFKRVVGTSRQKKRSPIKKTRGSRNAEKPCRTKCCWYCPRIDTTGPYKDVRTDVNCNTKNVVYVITAKNCRHVYVGETERKIKKRLYEHRRDIKNGGPSWVAKHFSKRASSLKFFIVKQTVKGKMTDKERAQLEKRWIKRLGSIYPNGLNII